MRRGMEHGVRRSTAGQRNQKRIDQGDSFTKMASLYPGTGAIHCADYVSNNKLNNTVMRVYAL